MLLRELTTYVLDHGLRDFSLRPTAEALGVTHATLLRHFKSREALLYEVIRTIRSDLLDRLASDPEMQAITSTRQLLTRAWRLLDNERGRREFLLLFSVIGETASAVDSPKELAEAAIRDWLAPIESALLKDGCGPRDVPTVATLALAMVRGLQLDLVATGDRQRAEAAFELALDTILPVGAG